MPRGRRKIRQELADLLTDPVDNVDVMLRDDNIRNWEVIFYVPSESSSLYAGGTFYVEINFPRNYPFQEPQIKFKTKIFHLSIGSHGRICIPIIFDNSWDHKYHGIKDMIHEICDLFVEPCMPYLCLENEFAWELYYDNKKLYQLYARACTKKFAKDKKENNIYFNVKKNSRSNFEHVSNWYVEWKQLRVFWIGFYKNVKNKQCLIHRLPKDIVKHILKFVAEYIVD